MAMIGTQGVPDPRVCEQARVSRDPRFDGLFYTAVTSTRIYCRPVCPVPTVKPEHVRYFSSSAAAEAAGFRPCLRCRPELAPGAWPRGDAMLERALKLIDEGLLADEPLAGLAERVGVGERQLRRLFVERLGASPGSVHRTRRLLFAKQLLTETTLPVTEVALEAGFGSLRRFNASFRKAYRMSPSDLRRKHQTPDDESLTLRLSFRAPYDFPLTLASLRAYSTRGVESVNGQSYTRAFGPPDAPGRLRVSAAPDDERTLVLRLHCPESVRILEVITRLRRMFDLDADPDTIGAALARDPHLRPLVRNRPGLRLPGGWDGFEVAVRAVLDRHAGPAAADDLIERLVRAHGPVLATPSDPESDRLFPSPAILARADLGTVGLPRKAAESLRAVARGLLDGRVDFRSERMLEDFVERWTSLPGIDRWVAHTIALRALGHPDAFPVDAVLRHRADGGHKTPTEQMLLERAEHWRPWRAYAAMLLHTGPAHQERGLNRSLRGRASDVHHTRRSS